MIILPETEKARTYRVTCEENGCVWSEGGFKKEAASRRASGHMESRHRLSCGCYTSSTCLHGAA